MPTAPKRHTSQWSLNSWMMKNLTRGQVSGIESRTKIEPIPYNVACATLTILRRPAIGKLR